MKRSLCRPFIAALPAASREALAALHDLEAVLDELCARAEHTRPGVALDRRDFVVYVAARLPEGDVAERALRNACAEDLYLACACLRKDETALQILAREILPVIERTLRAQRLSAALVEDSRQQILDQLLVDSAEQPAQLARYAGLGRLAAWLRVMVARVARRQLGREKKLVAVGDDALADRLVDGYEGPAVGRGAELELISAKAHYREAFKRAFKAALAELPPRDVLLLRQRYIDELGLERIATIYRVHHSTIHRRLEKVRAALLARTTHHLEGALSVSETECASIIRLIQSDFDMTLQTFFRRLAPASRE